MKELDPIKIIEQNFTREMVNDTLKYQKIYGFQIGNNNLAVDNESDAFRHAYMQAYLSLNDGGNREAKFLGDRHEHSSRQANGQYSPSSNMDLWNNQQGRDIANEIRREYPNYNKLSEQQRKNIIAQKVVQKMKSGELITNLEDRRKFVKQESKLPYTPTRSIGGVKPNGIPTGFAAPAEHIFTREELGKMSGDEFAQHEKAIMKQLKERGIPTKHELEKQRTSSRNSNSNPDDGHWVTINGNHVLMKD